MSIKTVLVFSLTDNNTVELELPSGSQVHPVFNFDKIEPYFSTDIDKYPLDSTLHQPSTSDGIRYSFDTVFFRDFSTKHVRYYVRWTGYTDDPANAFGFAYEEPSNVSMFLDLERQYGIFPEKGITSKNKATVSKYKRDTYGHEFPILVNTRTVSSTSVRNRSRASRSSILKKMDSTKLTGKVVEFLHDVSNTESIWLAGLLSSFDSSTNSYSVKWTDGTTSTFTASQALSRLLPPDPVNVADD